MSPMDIQSFREQLNSTKVGLCYFAHCSWAMPSARTVRSINENLSFNFLDPNCTVSEYLNNPKSHARSSIAKLIGASPEEIGLVQNTAEGINIIANGLGLRSGDNIVLNDIEFPANIYPWLNLEKKGVEIRFVRSQQGRISLRDIENAVDANTKVISISHVQYLSGFRMNLGELGQFCRGRNIFFVVDAMQSAGAMPIDVGADQIDFLCCSGYKWLMGPRGTGFLYCRRSSLKHLTPIFTGHNSMISYSEAYPYEVNLKDSPEKFELGVSSNALTFGLATAVDLLLEFGIGQIERRILDLTDLAASGLKAKGYQVLSPQLSTEEKSGILSFLPKSGNPMQLYEAMKSKNVIIAPRKYMARVAPHFYNTEGEVERFIDALPID